MDAGDCEVITGPLTVNALGNSLLAAVPLRTVMLSAPATEAVAAVSVQVRVVPVLDVQLGVTPVVVFDVLVPTYVVTVEY
jgi:hypothetical protein